MLSSEASPGFNVLACRSVKVVAGYSYGFRVGFVFTSIPMALNLSSSLVHLIPNFAGAAVPSQKGDVNGEPGAERLYSALAIVWLVLYADLCSL